VPHEFKAIEFSGDAKIASPFGAKVFRLERRQNEPFSLNRWYSFANGNTADHIGVIIELEELARKEAAN
jgi:hypothetical protein